jgi:hypothetical protein
MIIGAIASTVMQIGSAAYQAKKQKEAQKSAEKKQQQYMVAARKTRARKPGTAVGAELYTQESGASMTATSPLGVGNTGSTISPTLSGGGKGTLG